MLFRNSNDSIFINPIKTKKALILKSCTKLLIFVKFRSSYLLKKVKQIENTAPKAQIKGTMFRKTNVF